MAVDGIIDEHLRGKQQVGEKPASKHQIIPPGWENYRGLTRGGTVEPVLRDQILRRERRHGKHTFSLLN